MGIFKQLIFSLNSNNTLSFYNETGVVAESTAKKRGAIESMMMQEIIMEDDEEEDDPKAKKNLKKMKPSMGY